MQTLDLDAGGNSLRHQLYIARDAKDEEIVWNAYTSLRNCWKRDRSTMCATGDIQLENKGKVFTVQFS